MGWQRCVHKINQGCSALRPIIIDACAIQNHTDPQKWRRQIIDIGLVELLSTFVACPNNWLELFDLELFVAIDCGRSRHAWLCVALNVHVFKQAIVLCT